MDRARVVTLNAALGPLDYRVPDGMAVEPGSVVVAPLGPRQIVGVVWEPERLPATEVSDAKLRPLPARWRHRLGQDRVLFRSHRRRGQGRTAGARPPARDRADRTLPEEV